MFLTLREFLLELDGGGGGGEGCTNSLQSQDRCKVQAVCTLITSFKQLFPALASSASLENACRINSTSGCCGRAERVKWHIKSIPLKSN
ncbi:hypothetical protein BaRGS_00011919 [Batillaria attramentaria]|uniref:Hydrophobin n=1 Tax=Batillaria attramentaria TaxID=370345 RepID=A0ABD0LBX9_9CAEN